MSEKTMAKADFIEDFIDSFVLKNNETFKNVLMGLNGNYSFSVSVNASENEVTVDVSASLDGKTITETKTQKF